MGSLDGGSWESAEKPSVGRCGIGGSSRRGGRARWAQRGCRWVTDGVAAALPCPARRRAGSLDGESWESTEKLSLWGGAK